MIKLLIWFQINDELDMFRFKIETTLKTNTQPISNEKQRRNILHICTDIVGKYIIAVFRSIFIYPYSLLNIMRIIFAVNLHKFNQMYSFWNGFLRMNRMNN